MTNKITVTPDYTRYYSEKSKEWAISNKIVDNTDYSSKYYANESKKQADISTAKTAEVVESGNTAVSNIESARNNAITDIINQENLSVENVNTAGTTQVANVNSAGTTQVNLAKEQVTIATNKTTEVVVSGNTALSNITTAKNNAITTVNTEKTNAVNAVKTQQNTSISAVQNQQTSSVNTVKSTGQSYVDKCKAWASSPNVVEGGLYSAKYYAEMAQGKSDVTYETLRASRAYEDKGALLTDEQGFAEVAKYKHSTFDKTKFTVVGSPTITDEGVASGFSSGNYLKILNSVFSNIGNKTWKIEWSGNLPAKTSSPYPYVLGNNFQSTNSFINCGHFNNSDNWFFNVCVNDNGTPTLTSVTYLIPPSADYGKSYKCYIEFTGTKYIMGLKTASMSSFTTKEVENSNPIIPQSNDLALGYAMSTGSIDLKQFSITVDGKEVFSGNKTGLDVINEIEIPYTLSKTGSKIVDVAYRDRVIDLYEQEGQAGYYTIDEPNKNFTLPMGEIYGMIGQRSLISSIVTETNRVDIYSDKTCLICGNVATAGTINLPIELVNNNYFITLSTGEKTATSFTTTATGDYILIGKVL